MSRLQAIDLPGGGQMQRVVLEEGTQEVCLLSLGVALQDWRIAHGGVDQPVVLGFDDPAAYLRNPNYLGVIVGRVANRIGGARFTLDGEEFILPANEGRNLLHGGGGGLSSRSFAVDLDSRANAARFRYTSPHGEEGFPGRADFEITVALSGGWLRYEMRAMVDRPTPICLAQHAYYNLMGEGPIWDHELYLDGAEWTPVGADLIPTGDIAPLPPHMDYRDPEIMRLRDPQRLGMDGNILLRRARSQAEPAARLRAPNGLSLALHTDQPAIQAYTANKLAPVTGGLEGRHYAPFGGICLEPQHSPDSVNKPQFPSIIATPETPYLQRLDLHLSADTGTP
ncbi:Aldose 1-epimerase precursor [Pseudoruegeria aquimaris]|uniref:Aldose 1-epimerase n=1 Tax=Pseudoruegeria aquimaris TaxID=393663 RepID=A0A1Y5TD16_9RHOB|nr:aldose epimerase family protein [Pseudoruegeria aquimaris]SLN60972.1 Aldose 1-epimerase precursor [Pseudoruegeria aquimaris]